MKIFINEIKFETLPSAIEYFKDYCSSHWSYELDEVIQNSILNLRALRDEFQVILDSGELSQDLRPVVLQSLTETDSALSRQDLDIDLNKKITDNIEIWTNRFNNYYQLADKFRCYLNDCGLDSRGAMQIWVTTSSKSGDDQKHPEFVLAVDGIGLRMMFEDQGVISIKALHEKDYIDGVYFPKLDLEDLNHFTLERVVRVIKQKYLENLPTSK